MKVGCMVYESLKYGNFQCFFSESCSNQTVAFISNLQPNFWPKPLNRTNLMRFLSSDTFEFILQNDMLETWGVKGNFVGCYNSCSPLQCTYTALWKNTFVFILFRLIGLFGGLGVSLRIASPLVIKFCRCICARVKWKSQSDTINNEQFQGGKE